MHSNDTGYYPEKTLALMEFGCIDEDTICAVNHFSHNGKMFHEDIEKLVSEKGFLVSYDGMEIEILCDADDK